MKARIFAVLTILALAACVPLRAQQGAAPSPQSETPATPGDSSQNAKHDCCCTGKTDASEGAAVHDHPAMNCCHEKTASCKPSCCAGKDAKKMACCLKKVENANSVANCCTDMKDGQCAAKDGKSCCPSNAAKSVKACCAGMSGQRSAPPMGK